MNLSQLANSELLLRLEKLCRTERKITHVILWHILEVENRKLYADRGYASCFEYLTKGLGYSEGSAYRRLQSARLLSVMPESLSASISAKLENGSLNLSQLTQVQKCLKNKASSEKCNLAGSAESIVATESRESAANATEKLFELIENQNTFATQSILAKQFNLPVQIAEKITPQQNDSIKLEIILTTEQMKKLKQVQNLLSHICPDKSIASAVNYLVAEHILKSKKKAYLKDCCEYIDPVTDRKCDSAYQLQQDHIIPKAKGGGDDSSNLRTLCRTHNLAEARRWGLSISQRH